MLCQSISSSWEQGTSHSRGWGSLGRMDVLSKKDGPFQSIKRGLFVNLQQDRQFLIYVNVNALENIKATK